MVLVQLRDAQCAPVGFAALRPSLGANPFKLARPEYAGTLLRALQPHAQGDRIQLVIDDQPALTALLVGSGGDTVLQLFHLSGPLPSP
jgi:hypothetical protein